MKILVAEDNDLLRDAVTGLLEIMGHNTVAVASGEAALAEARSQSFDLVVSDYEMPGMSGVELREALPEQLRDRFILHSGNYGALQQAALNMCVVPKGSAGELKAAIEEMLAREGTS